VHLFDFNREIYGERVKVEIVEFIRPERKFASVEELVSQIGTDVEQAKTLFRAGI
jgi:riboflavin kinase/FMN adenylyltransferase